MKTIEHFFKTWAGLILCLVHMGILVYWAQPGDHGWVNFTLFIFMFLPIATLIVLVNRGGMSMALGLIYTLSFSIFVVGLAYVDRPVPIKLYFCVLVSLACNDIIRRSVQVESRHFNSVP